MTYEKPEVSVLGDAAHLIQSGGKNTGDAGPGTDLDCELDD